MSYLLPASRGCNVITFTPSWASYWKMEVLSNLEQIHWYKKCKILSDQCLMLVFKFPIMIFIFTYFICHVHHKLNVTYVTKLDAIIFSVLCSYWKKLSTTQISINTVYFQCICSKSVESTFTENSVYTYFFKNGRFSDVT